MDRIGFARLFSFESVRKGTLLLDEEGDPHVANILLVLRTPINRPALHARSTESASQRARSIAFHP
jgi:hypothetical protein